MRMARPSCLVLLAHLIFIAFDFAFASAGNSNPAKIAMIAITTRSSMRVKAFFVRVQRVELKLTRFVILTHLALDRLSSASASWNGEWKRALAALFRGIIKLKISRE